MLVLIQSASEGTTKTGSSYVYGSCLDINREKVAFKMWGTSLEESGLEPGNVYDVTCTPQTYQGTLQYIISNAELSDHPAADFIEIPEHHQRNCQLFDSLLEKELSPSTHALVRKVLSHPDVANFYQEFAATSVHDAAYGGLVYHSFKVTFYLSKLLQFQAGIARKVNKDLLLFAGALHDLGKVWEYDFGAVQPAIRIGHRVLLIEWLAVNFKADLVAEFGEEGYSLLLAIISTHHGKWEERPRTVEGMLVHLADTFDASVTHINDNIDNLPIRIDECTLS